MPRPHLPKIKKKCYNLEGKRNKINIKNMLKNIPKSTIAVISIMTLITVLMTYIAFKNRSVDINNIQEEQMIEEQLDLDDQDNSDETEKAVSEEEGLRGKIDMENSAA